MSPAPTRRAAVRELVVQEAVGFGERQVEQLRRRWLGREEHQAAVLGERRRGRWRERAAGCGRCRPMAGITVHAPSPSKHQPW